MLTLEATTRKETGRKTYRLRSEGKVPGVVYGAIEPKKVTLDRNAFVKVFNASGESTLVELHIDGESVNVLVQDLQLDPVRDEVIHVDFRAVDMTQEIEAEVKLEFVGESAAVKGLGGTLVHPFDTILVRALPASLPSSIEVNLAALATFEDAIHISDLPVGEGVKIMEDAHEVVATVSPPRSDEEMAKLDEAVNVDVSAVEVAGAKKEDAPEAGDVSAGDKKSE